jgi:hypothetical protein
MRPYDVEWLHTPHEIDGAAMTLMQVLSVEDSIKMILKTGEFVDYNLCISDCSSWNTDGVTVTVEGDYKHPPLYEEEEMVLDISFVKKYDALHNYQKSDTLGHYKKYIDYKQSNY